jgi:hypothetical protein
MLLTTFVVIVVMVANFSFVLTTRIIYPKVRRDESTKEVKFGIEVRNEKILV